MMDFEKLFASTAQYTLILWRKNPANGLKFVWKKSKKGLKFEVIEAVDTLLWIMIVPYY